MTKNNKTYNIKQKISVFLYDILLYSILLYIIYVEIAYSNIRTLLIIIYSIIYAFAFFEKYTDKILSIPILFFCYQKILLLLYTYFTI
jgi:hypothetical protein